MKGYTQFLKYSHNELTKKSWNENRTFPNNKLDSSKQGMKLGWFDGKLEVGCRVKK